MISLNPITTITIKAGATCALAAIAYVQPYRPMVFVGRSMEPTYSSRSIAFTEPIQPSQIRKGEVVVIDMDSGPIVKRIAFAPGDKILQAHLEGKWVDLIYVRPEHVHSYGKHHWREFVVPKDMVYVLGDNQAVSFDSKQFGCISTSRIHRVLVDQRPFDLFSNFNHPSDDKS